MRAFVFCCLALLAIGLAPTASEAEPRGRNRRQPEPKLNRLAKERSTYLRQHATNPVDWYPWCVSAFELAAQQNKPVLLSIGYAACHWCHVMNQESFADEKIAKVLNEAFVCIKVDREERPDLDRIYLNSLYALGSPGGWPMTLILTDNTEPFWGATYVKPEKLEEVAKETSDMWRRDAERLRDKGRWVVEKVRAMSKGPEVKPSHLSDRDIIQNARLAIRSRYDLIHGGFKGRRKFPPHGKFVMYFDSGFEMRPRELAHMAFTLDRMQAGGIHDQVGGGFHRYSIDERWFMPHFEKMLYDNALLVSTYSRMYALTGRELFGRAARRALAWLEHDMKRPTGGYGASLDADTNGVEGGTYTWTVEDLVKFLGESDAGFLGNLMGARQNGNYEGSEGKNVLFLPAPVETFARQNGSSGDLVRMRMDRVLRALLQTRLTRPQPPLDGGVITAWNGLLISGFVDAAIAFDDEKSMECAQELAKHLIANHRRPNGSLLRFPRGSGVEILGFLDDYAHFADGLIALADATDDRRWLTYAADLGRRMIRAFEDQENGGFWSSSHEGHEKLFAREKPYVDNPIPSDNGTAARVCLKLWQRTGEPEFREAADRTLAFFRPRLAQDDIAFNAATLISALRLRAQLEGADEAATGPASGMMSSLLRHDVARIALYQDGSVKKQGDKTAIRVRITLDAGWHVQPADAEEGVVATELAAKPETGLKLITVVFPPPIKKTLMMGTEAFPVYQGTFEVLAEVERKVELGTPTLLLTLQACDDNGTCREPMTIELPLK